MSEFPVPTSTTLTPGAISLPSFGPYFLVLANVAVANRGATVAAVTPRAIADLRFILFITSSLNQPCTDKYGCAILAYSYLNVQNGAEPMAERSRLTPAFAETSNGSSRSPAG